MANGNNDTVALQQTLFDLPNSPEQLGVLLPPASLRRIDFSALEYANARRAVIEYIKTYYPQDFNDFFSNNGVIMLIELLAYQTAVLSLRADLLANESFLPTAQDEDSVVNHLALINQQIRRATAATTNVECSVTNPVGADIHIPAGRSFSLPGEDGRTITYEIFRSPTDLTSDIVIPANNRAVIAIGIEGSTNVSTFVSDGTADQTFIVNVVDDSMLNTPIKVEVIDGDVTTVFNRVEILESASSNDEVYEVRFFEDRTEFVFGDNVTGSIPAPGAEIKITYRIGGGIRGRIGAGVIDSQLPITPDFPFKAAVQVRFRNVVPSTGGTDRESLSAAKKRAPREFSRQGSIVTSTDYAQVVNDFQHPYWGNVAKSVATIRTSLNANRVEIYVLAEGANGPIAPSAGLKTAIQTFIDEQNVLTDAAFVYDGKLKPVDVDATITMSRNADSSFIQAQVNQAITNFFSIDNFDMGEPLYQAELYSTLMAIEGVKNVDIFKPADNILATEEVDGDSDGVSVNELIVLGNKELRFYSEKIQN